MFKINPENVPRNLAIAFVAIILWVLVSGWYRGDSTVVAQKQTCASCENMKDMAKSGGL